MVDVPEPGTGSVSLNVVPSGGDSAAASGDAAANASAALTPPADNSLVLPGDEETASTDETEAAASAGPLAIPVIDEEAELAETGVADLELTAAGGSAVGLLQQRNIKIWVSVLAVAVAVLIGAFFFLARQTTLFQGSLIDNVNDDEPIVTAPPQTDFDENNEGVVGGNGQIVDPVTGEIIGTTTEQPEGTDGDANGDAVDDLLAQLLGEDGDESVVTDGFDFGDNGDGAPIVPGAGGSTRDPEFDDDLLNNTGVPRDQSNLPLPVGGSTDPGLGSNTVIPPQPGGATDNGIPGGAGTFVSSNFPSAPTTTPSLYSNTNPHVLQGGSVQGNTGPGVLVYFVPPFLAYLIRRRNVR